MSDVTFMPVDRKDLRIYNLARRLGKDDLLILLEGIDKTNLKLADLTEYVKSVGYRIPSPLEIRIDELERKVASLGQVGLGDAERKLLELGKSEPFTLKEVASLLSLIKNQGLSLQEAIRLIGGNSKNIEQTILSTIKRRGNRCRTTEILKFAKGAGFSNEDTLKALNELEKKGKIIHTKRSYQISPTVSLKARLRGLESISRDYLKQLKPGAVAVCPAKEGGIDFLTRHEYWGFLNIKRKPDYLALYISAPYSSILLFGEVENVRLPEKSEYEGFDYREGQKLIVLRPGSLKRLAEGIPKGEKKGHAPQSLRFTYLSELVNAKTLDDVKWGVS